jgi:hypothetical protein
MHKQPTFKNLNKVILPFSGYAVSIAFLEIELWWRSQSAYGLCLEDEASAAERNDETNRRFLDF